MGAWSTDILGSDDALDALGTISDIIGQEELYPLNFETQERRDEIRDALNKHQIAVVSKTTDQLDCIILPTVYMACGARIPEGIKRRALAACDAEIEDCKTKNTVGWVNPRERISYLEAHKNAILNFQPGEPVQTPTTGLFQKMSEHAEKKPVSDSMTFLLSPLANTTVLDDEKNALREKLSRDNLMRPVQLTDREIYVLVTLYNEAMDSINDAYGSQIA